MGGDENDENENKNDDDYRCSPMFVITAPSRMCLYPREGNCNAFVASPRGGAVLGVLCPPYGGDDDDDGRRCTYYEMRASGRQ
jgi:hypothetical protein